jgi:copper chaperone
METKKFVTNLKCGGCLAKVKPFLDEDTEISNWSVDLEAPEKLLTVTGEKVETAHIQAIFAAQGFSAEEKKGIFRKFFG